MGVAQSAVDEDATMDQALFERLNTFPHGLKERREVREGMSRNCIVALDDPEKERVRAAIRGNHLSLTEQRGLGAFFGMVCGDAVGAPLEFSSVRYGVEELTMEAVKVLPARLWTAEHYNTFRLKPGQWTDDASMGLCVADSLLVRGGQFDPQDLRLRFLNWWSLGYNNAFGWDDERQSKGSVGLGGNISMSMSEFQRDGTPYTRAGDANTSGNGSIMRNAAVPLCFFRDVGAALDAARKQSKTTHQGDEAAECCAVMTWLAVTAMNQPALTARQLLEALSGFESPLYSIQCLVNSRQEERHAANASTANLADRNWNWKDDNYRYSPSRAASQPGYVGSYCMDALAMALHCVWSTQSFAEALLKICNMRGDSDSTGSVCGQIAGAIYGIAAVPQCWIDAVERWDGHGTIALRAFRLMKLLDPAK